MLTRSKSSRDPSKRTRPRLSRGFGVECLEPRTVLSATQIVLIVVDPGTFGDNTPAPWQHERTIQSSAPVSPALPLFGIGSVPLWSVYSKQLPLMMGLGGARNDDLPPAPREECGAALPALPCTRVLPAGTVGQKENSSRWIRPRRDNRLGAAIRSRRLARRQILCGP